RRHAFNLGGAAASEIAGSPKEVGVDGVGPDARHPFVVRNFRVWDVHWAFHPVSPSVLVDNLDVYNAEYGIWRPIYTRHAYHAVSLVEVTIKKEFQPVGAAPVEADYPKPLDPVDDLPPATVITYTGRAANGQVLIRGTTCDNGTVKRVLVNGREAKPLRENFA